MEAINERIKRLRKEKNLNQTEISEMTGMSQRTISAIENGATDLSTKQLKLLSELFNVSTDYLIKGKEEERTISETEQEIIQLVRKDLEIKETLLNILETKKKAIQRMMTAQNHELMAA